MNITDVITQIFPEYEQMMALIKPIKTSKVLKRNLKASPDHVTLLASSLLIKGKLSKAKTTLPANIAKDVDVILDHVFDVKKSTDIEIVTQDYIHKITGLSVVYGIENKNDFVQFIYDSDDVQDKLGGLGVLLGPVKPVIFKAMGNMCDVILDAPGIGLTNTVDHTIKNQNKQYINEMLII